MKLSNVAAGNRSAMDRRRGQNLTTRFIDAIVLTSRFALIEQIFFKIRANSQDYMELFVV
jgi:hypothetical protein